QTLASGLHQFEPAVWFMATLISRLGRGHMPIDDSRKGYLATDVILVDAFDGALKKLAVDRRDPEALVVAKHLISIAKAGEGDPARLRDLTVKAARHNGCRNALPERAAPFAPAAPRVLSARPGGKH